MRRKLLLAVSLLVSVLSYAQTGSISGQIVDESNQPLEGATVFYRELFTKQ
ncbi:MAG: hypothetical protein QM763_14565 [Agriterribacter sp.]